MTIQREQDRLDESESSSAAFFSKREHQELLDDYSTSSESLSSSVDQDADLDLEDTCLHTLDLDLSYHNYDFSPCVAEQDTCFPTCDSSEENQGCFVGDSSQRGMTKTTNEGHANAGGRKVQFSTIEIRQYSITVGDNPGGRCGPPISLDWNYFNTSKMNLSNYENCRGPRRNKSELYIPSKERMWTLLKDVGCSMEEIKYASSVAESIRKGRLEKESHKGRMISIAKKILRMRIC